jgi:RimJ/RimL family protein N-acetyltransferase
MNIWDYNQRMLITDQELTIRNAEAKDAPLLCKWWNDGILMAHVGFPNGLGTTEEKIRYQISTDTDETRRLLIIEIASIPVGEMNFKNKGNGSVEIGIKVCEIDYLGKGYGTRFLKMLIQELFNEGYEKIVLDTWLKNVRAQHVYEKLGFKRIGVRKDCWKDQPGNLQSAIDYELVRENVI